jgi:adenylate cyclase class IV
MAEVEAKFHLTDIQVGEITRILGRPKAHLVQTDTYFDTPKGLSLRIREERNLALGSHTAYLTAKSVSDHTGGIRAVEEIEPVIDPDDIDVWTRMFTNLMGFPKDVTVEKQRAEYEIDRESGGIAKLVLDFISQLGHFCEIEIVTEASDTLSCEAATTELQKLIKELGLSHLTPATGSYRYMLKQKVKEGA